GHQVATERRAAHDHKFRPDRVGGLGHQLCSDGRDRAVQAGVVHDNHSPDAVSAETGRESAGGAPREESDDLLFAGKALGDSHCLRGRVGEGSVMELPDDQRRAGHGKTFASSLRILTSFWAASSGVLNSIIFAPVRGGGSSNLVGRVVPAELARGSRGTLAIGNFRDFRMAGSFAVRGSFQACCNETTHGSGASHFSTPDSVARWNRSRELPGSHRRSSTALKSGRPNDSARAAPTTPASSSPACLPHSTRSCGAEETARARARAAVSGSGATPGAISTHVAWSQPRASDARRTSSVLGAGPADTT